MHRLPLVSPLLLLLLLGASSCASGCAAMVRTWAFSADPVAGAELGLSVTEARVSQRTTSVVFDLENRSQAPARVEVGTLTLELPDGTRFAGKAVLFERLGKAARGLMAKVGLRKVEEPAPGLPPGGRMEARVVFRQYGRDLRRHPVLKVDLSGITVAGRSAGLPVLELTAPPEAPMGEDI